MTLPPRTADTMSFAIALSSPNGRMSKRARKAAQQKLSDMLFGDYQPLSLPPQPTEIEKLLREAKQCRDLAARGMRPRAFIRQAEWCEKRAAELRESAQPDPSPLSSQGRGTPPPSDRGQS